MAQQKHNADVSSVAVSTNCYYITVSCWWTCGIEEEWMMTWAFKIYLIALCANMLLCFVAPHALQLLDSDLEACKLMDFHLAGVGAPTEGLYRKDHHPGARTENKREFHMLTLVGTPSFSYIRCRSCWWSIRTPTQGSAHHSAWPVNYLNLPQILKWNHAFLIGVCGLYWNVEGSTNCG